MDEAFFTPGERSRRSPRHSLRMSLSANRRPPRIKCGAGFRRDMRPIRANEAVEFQGIMVTPGIGPLFL